MQAQPNFPQIPTLFSKKTKSNLSIISTSDIHLGVYQTPKIIEVLDAMIEDRCLKNADMFILAGDLTDRLLTMAESYSYMVVDWIVRALRACKKHDVVLFVLLGTPLHERDQPRWFVNQNDNLNIGCELYYAEQIEVVTIHSLKLDILAIPDLTKPAHEMWETAKECLRQRALEKVDLCIMHGFFDFQVPFEVKNGTHSSVDFLAITRYLIFIGHDHHSKVHDRIVVHGSICRHRHGEEEPKGFFIALIDRKTGNYELQFVENLWAKRFVQIHFGPDTPPDEIYNKVMSVLKDLPSHSHIQFVASRELSPSLRILEWRKQYPLINWSFSPKDKDNDEERETIITIHQPPEINRNNIVGLTAARLKDQGTSDDIIELCVKELQEYVENVDY